MSANTDTAAGAAGGDDRPEGIARILDDVRAAGRDADPVTIDAILSAMGRASHAAVLLVTAAIAATPLSGIPGVSVVCGVLIAVIAAQMVFGRRSLWLPEWALRQSIDADKLEKWLGRIRPAARFVDRHTHRRLTALVTSPGATLPRVLCMLSGAVMPFLEVIPFTSSIMATAVVFFSVSLVTRDGLLALIGMLIIAGAAGAAIYVL